MPGWLNLQMQRNPGYKGTMDPEGQLYVMRRFSTVRRVSSSNLYMTLEQESTILNEPINKYMKYR